MDKIMHEINEKIQTEIYIWSNPIQRSSFALENETPPTKMSSTIAHIYFLPQKESIQWENKGDQ